jgi:hypothetical protein
MNTLHLFFILTFSYNLITKLEQKGQPQKDHILLFAQRKLVSVQRETLEYKEQKCFSRRCLVSKQSAPLPLPFREDSFGISRS